MASQQSQQNEEEEDYSVSGPLLVNKLQEAGINPQDIKKLSESGLNTVEAVAYTPKKALMAIKGISEQKHTRLYPSDSKAPQKSTHAAPSSSISPQAQRTSTPCSAVASRPVPSPSSSESSELESRRFAIRSLFCLLIVDSVTNLYRTDFNGRGELSARQTHLGKFLRTLQRLADEFGVAVVITNQVMSNPDASAGPYVGNDKKPIGGNILAHASTTRLQLKKGRANTRQAKIYDSPCLPESESMFAILASGIGDPEEET
ncbi:Rad51-domain-containing protein [Irpex lacteus]|nr:Rad51-domain-containing protein [Irpex lacteus]